MRAHASALVLALLMACGGAQNRLDQAASGVNVALGATNAARDAMLAWDKQHQSELVESSTTKEQADAKLAHYRAQRKPVEKAFAAAYNAIAAAAAGLAVAQLGGNPDRELGPMLSEVIKAVLAVKSTIAAVQDVKGDTR